MKQIKYLFQFIIVILFFLIFKILGLKISKIISSFIFKKIGPLFKSKIISDTNLIKVFPKLDNNQRKITINKMWGNYGKIFAEYMFLNKFRTSPKFWNKIIIKNQEELNKIKSQSKPVIFVSGHFNNFELMAMHIERSGINLAAIYRPLNNKFLNPLMESIRTKYICKKQIKKGISGTKQLLEEYKKGSSIALMIDQRVSEGVECDFFGYSALTTTIPAQFIKKFNLSVVPVYIERLHDEKFKLEISKSIQFSKENSLEEITLKLNKILEQMIIKNPDQWIWTHNRWKI